MTVDITHYTLQAKLCANGMPFGNPDLPKCVTLYSFKTQNKRHRPACLPVLSMPLVCLNNLLTLLPIWIVLFYCFRMQSRFSFVGVQISQGGAFPFEGCIAIGFLSKLGSFASRKAASNMLPRNREHIFMSVFPKIYLVTITQLSLTKKLCPQTAAWSHLRA